MQINRTEKFIGGVNSFLVIPASLFAVLAVFFITLSTFNPSKVHAEASSSEDAEVSLDVNSVINIATPTTSTLNCTPGATSASATLCTTTANINVATNNLTGYTLQMNATNGSPTALTNTAVSPSATISTLTQSYSSANFPTNYWGYTGGLDKSSESGGYNCANNYCPILAYQSTDSNYAPNHVIKVTDAPASSSNTTITFGSKVDISKPSGTYSTSVTFTAVANYVAPTTFQSFTASDCAKKSTDTTFTLTDSRDGTDYTVAKLQDGNCWMTQNLELGTSGQSLALTSATSNVPSNGYTLTLGTEQSHYKGDTTTKYGNFYTFAQATAGSGSTTTGEDAPYDICPKNWRLPSASSTGATDSEFYTMLNHYLDSSKWDGFSWYDLTTTEFTNPPVSLVFSGSWYSGSLSTQGNRGHWWSSTSGGSSNAFILGAYSDGYVYPRSGLNQTDGFTVRCLVPGA